MDKRLRERERWFGTTLRSIADAVITVDLGGNVTFMNPVAEELTGVKLERAIARGKAVMVPEATIEYANRPSRVVADSAAPVFDDDHLLGAA